MDITPHVNLLKSLRGERIDYVLLVGEAIDNAFDAGARRIDISMSADALSFEDDGIGITKDRIASLFSLGEHGAMTTTRLGRFGVGIKSQAVNAGNIFDIISTSTEGRVRVSADWRKILKSGNWSIDDPRWMPAAIGDKTGTTISILDLRATKVPLGGWPNKIIADAAERFYPAIATGQSISLNGDNIPIIPEPKMMDLIDRQITLSDGRSAHIRAGILTGSSRLNQVHVGYRHRVIMPASSLGCGEYGGLRKMFARVQLDGAWHLAKFKNDLTDEDEREELEEAVGEALKPILEKCNTASLSAKVTEISHMINDLVPPDLAAARPHKQKKEKGKGKKTGSNGQVDKEKADPLGPAKTRRPPHDRLLITFDGDAEVDGIGVFKPGRPHRVNLSRDDPHIKRLLEARDQEIGVYSLFALAIALFEYGRQELPAPELEFVPFGKRIANLISIQHSEIKSHIGT